MTNNLGTILAGIREKEKISQKSIADGIISSNFMCKLEKGEKELDYVVMETLFERLGKCADKIEKGITNDDYQLIRLRDEIADCISKNDSQSAKMKLEEYTAWTDMKNNVHKQYYRKIEALIEYLDNRDAQACKTQLLEALQITHAKWNQNGSMYLCNQEIRIVLLITYMKIMLGELQEAEEKLNAYCIFLLHHYTDKEELVKIYPHAMWLLAKVYFRQDKVEEALITIQKAKECLYQNGSLMPMYALLELEGKCLELSSKQYLLQENMQCREAFDFLYNIVEEQMPIEEKHIVGAFQKQFYYQWIDSIISENPVLSAFNRISQNKALHTFAEKDTEQFEINKAKIRAELSSMRPSLDMIASGSALAMLHNFGPLNRAGGERRLNVAVTRAKCNVQLVSSMHCTIRTLT